MTNKSESFVLTAESCQMNAEFMRHDCHTNCHNPRIVFNDDWIACHNHWRIWSACWITKITTEPEVQSSHRGAKPPTDTVESNPTVTCRNGGWHSESALGQSRSFYGKCECMATRKRGSRPYDKINQVSGSASCRAWRQGNGKRVQQPIRSSECLAANALIRRTKLWGKCESPYMLARYPKGPRLISQDKIWTQRPETTNTKE